MTVATAQPKGKERTFVVKKDNTLIIKAIIKTVSRITATGDTNFDEDLSRSLASSLMSDLIEHFGAQPKFVAAILEHLTKSGFDMVSRVKGETNDKFVARFGSRISRMDESQMARVREINSKLFSQHQ